MYLPACSSTDDELTAPASGVRAVDAAGDSREVAREFENLRGRLEALAWASSVALTSLARIRYQATGEVFTVHGVALHGAPSHLSEALSASSPEALLEILTELIGHYDDLAKGHALCRVLESARPRVRQALGSAAVPDRAAAGWR